MDKPASWQISGPHVRLTIMLVMTLWGGVGILFWLRGGMHFGFGNAYAAGSSIGTVILFLMLGFGLHGLRKAWKAEKGGAAPKPVDGAPLAAEDEPPGPLARIIYAVMMLLGTWGFVRWLLAGMPLEGDRSFGAWHQYLTVVLMLALIGCGAFGLWRARKVLMRGEKKKE